MEIEILGAHNCESRDARLVSLLIDHTLVIDAGSITSSLPVSAQQGTKAVLLTGLWRDEDYPLDSGEHR